jgi:hypothetical protein
MPHDPDRAELAVVLQSFMNDLSNSRMIHFFMDNRSCTENSPISTRAIEPTSPQRLAEERGHSVYVAIGND